MKKINDKPIAVIGAGITGLTLAYYLVKAGRKVIVFEKKDKVGGLLDSFNLNGTLLEKYYHHIIMGFGDLLEFLKEINMGNSLIWRAAKMGFLYNGRLSSFNGPLDLMRFSPLTLSERIKLGLSLFRMSRLKNWEILDNFTAEEILKNYSGEAAWQKIWRPLLKMKFGDDFGIVSAAWIWDRIKTRSKSQQLVKSKECLGYLKGGFQKLPERLASIIASGSAEVLLSSAVSKISFRGNGEIALRYKETEMAFSKVISTIPLPLLLNIITNLAQQHMSIIKKVKYQDVICVLFRLRKRLTNFYWINIVNEDVPFVVAVEHTNFIEASEYGGENIVYLLKYCSEGDTFFLLDDNAIKEKGVETLKNISHLFREEDIIDARVFRDKYAQPVFVKGYSNTKERLSTAINGLILADSSQVYPNSRSINSAISLAKHISNQVILNNA